MQFWPTICVPVIKMLSEFGIRLFYNTFADNLDKIKIKNDKGF